MQLCLPTRCLWHGEGGRHLIERLAAVGLTDITGGPRSRARCGCGPAMSGRHRHWILLLSNTGSAPSWPRNRHVGPVAGCGPDRLGYRLLGAGIIITRRGAVHGSHRGWVWDSAAIARRRRRPAVCWCRLGADFVRAWRSMWWSASHGTVARNESGCTSSTAGGCATAILRAAGSENADQRTRADPHDIERRSVA